MSSLKECITRILNRLIKPTKVLVIFIVINSISVVLGIIANSYLPILLEKMNSPNVKIAISSIALHNHLNSNNWNCLVKFESTNFEDKIHIIDFDEIELVLPTVNQKPIKYMTEMRINIASFELRTDSLLIPLPHTHWVKSESSYIESGESKIEVDPKNWTSV